MKVICSYSLLIGNKNTLPLFVQFMPNNQLILNLKDEIVNDSSKLTTLVDILSTWFTDLTVIKKEQ